MTSHGELDDLAADLRLDHGLAVALLPADRLGAGVDLPAVLLDLPRDDIGALAVDAGQDPLQALEHDQLGAEALEGLPELEPDDPAADAHHPLRDVRQVERRGAVEHALAVELEAGDLDRQRAGRDHDVLRLDDVLRLAVAVRQLDPVRVEELRRGLHVGCPRP
jgi:hypothetical protein